MIKWIQRSSSKLYKSNSSKSCEEYIHICCSCMDEIRRKKIHPMIIILDGDREQSVSFVSRFLSHKYLFKEHKCSIDRLVCHRDRHVIRAHELTDDEINTLRCTSISHVVKLYIQSSDDFDCCNWNGDVISHLDFKQDHDYCLLKNRVIEYIERLYARLNC
jgi:hypothetical protein